MSDRDVILHSILPVENPHTNGEGTFSVSKRQSTELVQHSCQDSKMQIRSSTREEGFACILPGTHWPGCEVGNSGNNEIMLHPSRLGKVSSEVNLHPRNAWLIVGLQVQLPRYSTSYFECPTTLGYFCLKKVLEHS